MLRKLRYLVALAETGHFGRAAELCHISQPALSSAIQQLEQELGVPLVLRRHHRFVGMTPEGKRLLKWARRLLADWESLKQEAGALRTQLSGALRLGAIPTSLPVIPLISSPLIVDHPQVQVIVRSLSAEEIIHRLDRFELDLGITYAQDLQLKGFRCQPLYEEHYFLLTREETQFAHGSEIAWSRLAELPLCLLTPEMQNRQIIEAAFRQAGVTPKVCVETDSIFVLYAQVRYGGLFGIMPHSMLLPFELRQEITAIRLKPPLTRTIVAIAPAREPWPPVLRAVWALLERLNLQSRLDALIRVID